MGRNFLATTALALLALASPALAQDGVVKIGVLNDQSTSFSALGGSEVITATELAVKDYGGEALGKKIEIVSADSQNKPEVGLFVSPLTDRPTEADCNGYVTSWAYDAYSTFKERDPLLRPSTSSG